MTIETIERVSLPDQHYLYVNREAAITGEGIAEAMASGFGELFRFCTERSITGLTMPATIYVDMPSDGKMRFRSAFFVRAEQAAQASGDVMAGRIPAGDAFKATHIGSYANLNQSHNALWASMDEQGAAKGMPIWEIYVDDPQHVAESDLRTEIFRAVT